MVNWTRKEKTCQWREEKIFWSQNMRPHKKCSKNEKCQLWFHGDMKCLAFELKMERNKVEVSQMMFPCLFSLLLSPAKLHFPLNSLNCSLIGFQTVCFWYALDWLWKPDFQQWITSALHMAHNVATTTHLLLLNMYFLPKPISFQTVHNNTQYTVVNIWMKVFHQSCAETILIFHQSCAEAIPYSFLFTFVFFSCNASLHYQLLDCHTKHASVNLFFF